MTGPFRPFRFLVGWLVDRIDKEGRRQSTTVKYRARIKDFALLAQNCLHVF